MHRLLFEPLGMVCFAEEGNTLLHVAQEHGVALRSECGAKGRCGKCRISAYPGECLSPPSAEEHQRLSPQEIAGAVRLACQAMVVGEGTIVLPPETLESDTVLGKTQLTGHYPVRPMVERIVLHPESRSKEAKREVRDLVGWMVSWTEAAAGKRVVFREPDALRELSEPFVSRGPVTLVNHRTRGVTAFLKGEHNRSLGFAVDVGTTTLAVYLCDLKDGRVLTSMASGNPQRRFGEDVVSRIAFADSRDDGKDILHRLVMEELNGLFRRSLAVAGAQPGDVDEVVVVGNTTMEHLFSGLHPHSLGRSPYLPLQQMPPDLRSADIGLDLNPGTNVHPFPVVSGFVGGDTIGAILAETPHRRDEVSLIVDIGTNGEVVLGNREGLWVTSCATGPALEGAQISCGMRAASGAVHQVEIDPSTYRVSCRVIGEEEGRKPRGICGSGIIDVVAAMSRTGLLLASGRMNEGMPGVECDAEGTGRRFLLVPSGESAGGAEIALTLSDIRQIQLAKAALYAGIRILMRRAGIRRIDRMVLTGAFGARFNWRNAVSIGMLPKPGDNAAVKVVENAAGVGAVMALLDRRRRKEAVSLAKAIRFVELAEDPDFSTEFPMAMIFPSNP